MKISPKASEMFREAEAETDPGKRRILRREWFRYMDGLLRFEKMRKEKRARKRQQKWKSRQKL